MAGTRKTIHIYGKQPVNEAVESGWPVVEIIVRGKGDDRQVRPILDKARDRNIKISGMEPRDFDLRYAKASQGIAARVGDVVFKHPEQLLAGVPRNQTPLFVALDGIQDPQNLGSICRTSHAMGVHGLVVPRRRTAPFGEGAFKASAGAVFYLPISEVLTSTILCNGVRRMVYGYADWTGQLEHEFVGHGPHCSFSVGGRKRG